MTSKHYVYLKSGHQQSWLDFLKSRTGYSTSEIFVHALRLAAYNDGYEEWEKENRERTHTYEAA